MNNESKLLTTTLCLEPRSTANAKSHNAKIVYKGPPKSSKSKKITQGLSLKQILQLVMVHKVTKHLTD